MIDVQRVTTYWDHAIHELERYEDALEQSRTAATLMAVLDEVSCRLRHVRNAGICKQKLAQPGLTSAAIAERTGLSGTQVKEILRTTTVPSQVCNEQVAS